MCLPTGGAPFVRLPGSPAFSRGEIHAAIHHCPQHGHLWTLARLAQGLACRARAPRRHRAVPQHRAARSAAAGAAAVRHLRAVHRGCRRARPRPRPCAGAHGLARGARAGVHRRPGGASGGQRQRGRRAADPAMPGPATGAGRTQRRAGHPARMGARRHRHPRDGLRRAPRKPRPRGGGICRRGAGGRRRHAAGHHPRVRARGDRPRPRDPAGQHQPPRARTDGDRAPLPGEGERQHRQLGAVLGCRRGSGKAGVGDPLGRRHRDGPVHRAQHPQPALVDPAQRAGADRHRAAVPGVGKGGRQPGAARLGGVPRHPGRAGRTGRGLLHDPRRRAPRPRTAGQPPDHRHRLARRLDHGALVPGASPRELPVTSTSRTSARSCAATTSPFRWATACAPAASPTPTTPRNSPSWTPWASWCTRRARTAARRWWKARATCRCTASRKT